MKKVLTAIAISLMTVSISSHASEGQAIYNQYCMGCHGTGIGPMASKKEAWQPRLQTKGGVDGLLESAKNGLNAMPPKGTCMACTDEQLRSAIVFMTTFK